MADSDESVVVVKSNRFATNPDDVEENPLGIVTAVSEDDIVDGVLDNLTYPAEHQDRYHAFIKFQPKKITPPQIKGGPLGTIFKDIFSFRDSSSEQDDLQSTAKTANTELTSDTTKATPSGTDSTTSKATLNLPTVPNDPSTAANLETPNAVGVSSGEVSGNKPELTARQEGSAGNPIKIFMPVSFTTSDTIQYENASLGIMGGALEGSFNAGSDKTTQIIADSMSKGIEGIQELLGLGGDGAKAGAARVISKSTLARATKGSGFESVRNAIGSSARVTVNPNVRTLFRGVAIRSFTFDFKLISKSETEASIVENIIKSFRLNAHPETTSLNIASSTVDAVYDFPNMFEIQVNYMSSTGTKRIGPKMKKCYLTSIRTVYNASSMAFHPDGRPVEVDLSLTFMEEIPLDKQDIRDGF